MVAFYYRLLIRETHTIHNSELPREHFTIFSLIQNSLGKLLIYVISEWAAARPNLHNWWSRILSVQTFWRETLAWINHKYICRYMSTPMRGTIKANCQRYKLITFTFPMRTSFHSRCYISFSFARECSHVTLILSHSPIKISLEWTTFHWDICFSLRALLVC